MVLRPRQNSEHSPIGCCVRKVIWHLTMRRQSAYAAGGPISVCSARLEGVRRSKGAPPPHQVLRPVGIAGEVRGGIAAILVHSDELVNLERSYSWRDRTLKIYGIFQ